MSNMVGVDGIETSYQPGRSGNEPPQTKWCQYLAGFAASLSIMSCGAWFTWPAPLLPQLLGPDSPVPMTREEASWMVSAIEAGVLLGSFPAPIIADRFGRKLCLLISMPGFLVAVLLKVLVKSFTALCVARIIEGVSFGIVYVSLPMYLGEIASPEVRGTITNMFQIANGFGCLLVYCVGPYLSYDNFTYFVFGTTVLFVVCFSWQPESPYFYAKTGNSGKATEMLRRLRHPTSPELIQSELEEIKEEVKKADESKASFKDVVATPGDRRALLLIIIAGGISYLSGQNAILTYTTDTFSQFPDSFISADNVTLGLGLVAFLGCVFSIFVSDKLGRRFLLLVSATACTLTLFIASAYFYLNSNTTVPVSTYSWVAALALIVFNLFVTAGLLPVCITYISELFPTNTRGLASSISSINMTICSFLVLKCYETLASAMGTYFPYTVFGSISLLGLVIFYLKMPETRGKTFTEIRAMLDKNILR